MQFTNRRRHEVRIVTHRKVIPLGHHHLAGIGEQLPPTWLKSKRIVAFAENREQRELTKGPGKRLVEFLIDLDGFASVAQIAMESANSLTAYAGVKRLTAGCVKMKANAKCARRHSHEAPRPRTQFPD